jgi:hypothetical protein
MRFGPWILPSSRFSRILKFLRGTALDPFGRTEEAAHGARADPDYEQTVEQLLAGLSAQNHAGAVQIASLPDEIRGFGHIKKRNVEAARKKQPGAPPALQRARRRRGPLRRRRRMRIAYLEDDADQATLIRKWLEQAGHICHYFDRGHALQRSLARSRSICTCSTGTCPTPTACRS